MSSTYEDMSILISATIDATAMRTAIDLETLVLSMKQSGASEAVIRQTLLNDLDIGGRIFGQFKNGVKNTTRSGILGAGNLASRKTYEKAGITEFKWVTVSGKPCPDCEDRHGEVGTLKYFEVIGTPRSGFSVCGVNCQCQLEPEAYKGSGLSIPLVRGKRPPKKLSMTHPKMAGKHKTIQDAEQWAKANSVNENQPLEILGSRRFGVNNVGFNYKDLDIVDANKVNIAIKNFNNVCDKLKIPRIEGFASAHSLMPSIADAAMGDSNLFVKKIVFKKGERDLKLFGKSVGKIDYSQQAIWHEFGHHIHHNLGVTLKNMSAKNPNMTNLGWEKLTPLERKIEKAYKEVQKAGVSTENFFPTTYSTSNSVEWFAECFTFWINKKGTMPDSFLKLIKEEGIADAITR